MCERGCQARNMFVNKYDLNVISFQTNDFRVHIFTDYENGFCIICATCYIYSRPLIDLWIYKSEARGRKILHEEVPCALHFDVHVFFSKSKTCGCSSAH